MNNIRLDFDAYGPAHGPLLIFLHSLGQNRGMWSVQVAELCGEFRGIAIDLRGHGSSPAPSGPYTITELADDVVETVDSLGATEFMVCGISIGGMIALQLAVSHPDRIPAVIAANTGARVGTAESWQARVDLVDSSGMDMVAESIVHGWFDPTFAATNPEVVENARRALRETSPAGYIGCCRALGMADLRGRVGGIEARTLIVAGAEDRSTPVALAESLRDEIPGSRLVVISGASHLSNLDAAQEFNQVASDFLEGVG
ncbi:MAG TPA: 3-oxoadipate enol-lactonase [Acidimicrobiia bacterium]